MLFRLTELDENECEPHREAIELAPRDMFNYFRINPKQFTAFYQHYKKRGQAVLAMLRDPRTARITRKKFIINVIKECSETPAPDLIGKLERYSRATKEELISLYNEKGFSFSGIINSKSKTALVQKAAQAQDASTLIRHLNSTTYDSLEEAIKIQLSNSSLNLLHYLLMPSTQQADRMLCAFMGYGVLFHKPFQADYVSTTLKMLADKSELNQTTLNTLMSQCNAEHIITIKQHKALCLALQKQHGPIPALIDPSEFPALLFHYYTCSKVEQLDALLHYVSRQENSIDYQRSLMSSTELLSLFTLEQEGINSVIMRLIQAQVILLKHINESNLISALLDNQHIACDTFLQLSPDLSLTEINAITTPLLAKHLGNHTQLTSILQKSLSLTIFKNQRPASSLFAALFPVEEHTKMHRAWQQVFAKNPVRDAINRVEFQTMADKKYISPAIILAKGEKDALQAIAQQLNTHQMYYVMFDTTPATMAIIATTRLYPGSNLTLANAVKEAIKSKVPNKLKKTKTKPKQEAKPSSPKEGETQKAQPKKGTGLRTSPKFFATVGDKVATLKTTRAPISEQKSESAPTAKSHLFSDYIDLASSLLLCDYIKDTDVVNLCQILATSLPEDTNQTQHGDIHVPACFMTLIQLINQLIDNTPKSNELAIIKLKKLRGEWAHQALAHDFSDTFILHFYEYTKLVQKALNNTQTLLLDMIKTLLDYPDVLALEPEKGELALNYYLNKLDEITKTIKDKHDAGYLTGKTFFETFNNDPYVLAIEYYIAMIGESFRIQKDHVSAACSPLAHLSSIQQSLLKNCKTVRNILFHESDESDQSSRLRPEHQMRMQKLLNQLPSFKNEPRSSASALSTDAQPWVPGAPGATCC